MSEEQIISSLKQELFQHAEQNVYAVLDGAATAGLLAAFEEHGPAFVCLYRGELDEELATCAPYLVNLQPDTGFTNWLLRTCAGKNCGIYLISRATLHAVRKHLRTLLMVESPEGKLLYFRFYDPRVLGAFLPTCNADEAAFFCGPVNKFVFEYAGAIQSQHFSP